MTDPRLARYADLICEYSLGIEDSHRLFILTPSEGAPLAVAVAREAWRRGARASVAMGPAWGESDLLRYGSDDQVAYLDPATREEVERFDRWLFVWAPGNTAELPASPAPATPPWRVRAVRCSSGTRSARPPAS